MTSRQTLLVAALMAAPVAYAGQSASLRVPLNTETGWSLLRFAGIPPNVATFSASGLRIEVRSSAGPIVRKLERPVRVSRVRARGRILGRLDIEADTQGTSGFDDYAMRIGLVETGERRLGFFQRQFAPEWVRALHGMATDGQGIAGVQFLNLGVARSQIGSARRHPLSDLLNERTVAVPDSTGSFQFDTALEAPIETLAVWISADGDDTGSSYVVELDAIELVEDRVLASTPRPAHQALHMSYPHAVGPAPWTVGLGTGVRGFP
jgi:hypothetical protein